MVCSVRCVRPCTRFARSVAASPRLALPASATAASSDASDEPAPRTAEPSAPASDRASKSTFMRCIVRATILSAASISLPFMVTAFMASRVSS